MPISGADKVFKALADSGRRHLLDSLHHESGGRGHDAAGKARISKQAGK